MILNVSSIYKFCAALAGVLGVVVTQFTADGTVAHYLNVAITALSALLVYWVPNAAPAPAAVAPKHEAGYASLDLVLFVVALVAILAFLKAFAII